METDSSTTPGFVDSLRAMCDGILAGTQARIALFSADLLEEKYGLIRTCFGILAVFFTGTLAIAFASLFLVYASPPRDRLAALGGLALLYVLAFLGAILLFRRQLARQPAPLADTLEEFEEDRACTRPSR